MQPGSTSRLLAWFGFSESSPFAVPRCSCLPSSIICNSSAPVEN
eukprot:CAMPEP_0178996840 /NCGR_PEP_ID=MMETSP0795-20121207/8595_1 /TAXON_ID=88552 /ORGANISM="Amoebophrya sp., Strain Ameob2" /LENGTH=43 /DNA_ID= /DNA_START= /DNA_END= /DNA_ORIENTATION=